MSCLSPDTTRDRNGADVRNAWIARAYAATASCDIVFADPDNGLQCKSVGPYHRLGPKYAFYDDLLPLIERDQTVVIYHHACRQGSADAQIMERLRHLGLRRPTARCICALRFRRGNSRAFLVVPAAAHERVVRLRVKQLLAGQWRQHFTLLELGA